MNRLESAARDRLLRLARNAIRWGVDQLAGTGYPLAQTDRAAFPEQAACFVSLYTPSDDLRGCIGSLDAERPLAEAVAEAALGAARRDPRFRPLTADELGFVRIEISVLSAAELVPATTEADLLAQLRPGVDGVVLAHGEQRATLLPAVWEQFEEATEFLVALKRKVGLPSDAWPEGIRCYRYTAERFGETHRVAGGQSDAV